MGLLQGKQQVVAYAILRRRHPRPASLALLAIADEVPNPFQAKPNRPTVPVLSTDGRSVGRRHIMDGLTPVAIDQSGTIRCAVTDRTLFIAPGSITARANPGAAEQINLIYQPALHQVLADHSQHVEAAAKP